MSHVQLIDIDKHYGGYHALRSVNLSVDKGEFIVMVGPNARDTQALTVTWER